MMFFALGTEIDNKIIYERISTFSLLSIQYKPKMTPFQYCPLVSCTIAFILSI